MICERCGKWAGAHATLPGQPKDHLCMCQPDNRAELRERNAAWWALVMGAAAALEDAACCLSDQDAKKAAEGAAEHYRAEANALWPNAKVRGPTAALSPEAPSRLPGYAGDNNGEQK